MIFDGTYIDKETETKLNNDLGKAYGLIERFKLGGIGSHRMIIAKSSAGFQSIVDKATGTIYGSIEHRPKGILIHVNIKNTRYSWSIPFFKMVTFQSEYFSIHSEGEFLSFVKNGMFHRNKLFLSRLNSVRSNYLSRHQLPMN